MSTQPDDLHMRALAIVAAGGVRQVAAVPHPVRIVSPDGVVSPPTIDDLVREGWARVDSSRSLHDGQPVEITPTGLALLRGNRLPGTTPAGDGPTGDQVLATALRAAIRHGHIGVHLHDDVVEISGSDDTVLASVTGRFTAVALAGFLGIDPARIEDAR
ncbi:hypothetical protein ABT301_29125 [Streptomyces sp. NPDC000987]|uniref:hypothetical protein n=1 Tax=Streptomyces sp. NPDC000987 TaxID=3154374 RepID=UPI00332168DD